MPATPSIATLIDKVDNFEVVRDEIVAILVIETTNQMLLASAASEDPRLWNLRVFSERLNPWAEFLDGQDQPQEDTAPIVNVSFDKAEAVKKGSNSVERQQLRGTFNVDCYGYGVSTQTTGHTPGDEKAALEAQRAARLVRNILMSSHYTYLGALRGVVGSRWVGSITSFKPDIDNRTVQQVAVVRVALEVEFNEFSPQYVAETLELLSVAVTRRDNGQVLLTADYD